MTPTQAKELMAKWIESVMISGVKCFNNFMNTLNNCMDIITNYFDGWNNSGFVEGCVIG